MHIGSIEKLQLTTTGSPLLIRCKTFLFVTFVIPREKECHDVYTTLQKLYQPVHIQNLYCFQYTSSAEELTKSAGWNYFRLDAEFKRQRVPNDKWTLCNLNVAYEICDTCEYRCETIFCMPSLNPYQFVMFLFFQFIRSTTDLCTDRGNNSHVDWECPVSFKGSPASTHIFAFQFGIDLSV